MKLIDERSQQVNTIRSYRSGELQIGEATYRRSCIVAGNAIVGDWPPQSLDELRSEHLDAVIALQPEVVLLGSGTHQRFPSPVLLAAFLSRGIGVEVMDTGAACRTYNVLVGEHRRAVAALFLAP